MLSSAGVFFLASKPDLNAFSAAIAKEKGNVERTFFVCCTYLAATLSELAMSNLKERRKKVCFYFLSFPFLMLNI